MQVPDLAVDEDMLLYLPEWRLRQLKNNYQLPKINFSTQKYTTQSFKWTDTEYTPRQLMDNFFHYMPFLVMTTDGYLGRDEGINSVSSRVIVVNDYGAYFSIPITCKTPVIPLKCGAPAGKPIELKDLLDKNVSKTLVFTDDGSQYVYEDSGSGESIKFGKLKIVDRYEERYLLLHTVATDRIYHEAAIIPLYLPTTLVIAVAMAEGDHRHYYRNMLQIHSFIRNIPKEVAFPLHLRDCEDIMIFDHKPKEGTYDVLLPNKYATINKFHQTLNTRETHVYTPLTNKPPSNEEQQRPLPRIPTESGQKSGEWRSEKVADRVMKRESSTNVNIMDNYGGSRGPHSNIGQLIGHDYNIVSVNPLTAVRELYQVLKTGAIPLKSSVTMVDVSCCSDPERENRKTTISGIKVTRLADIPEDLSLLDCAAVGQCLTLLHLSKHRSIFEQEQIDGRLLIDLDVDILQKEFAFSKFEALKLDKFIRGWRPNANETAEVTDK